MTQLALRSSRRARLRTSLVACCLIGLSWSANSLAQKRVIVMDFTGPAHRPARAALVDRLQHKQRVIPRHTLVATAKSLRLGTVCNQADIARLARPLGAEVVICGDLSELSRRRLQMTIKVFNAGDGRLMRSLRAKLSRRQLTPRIMTKIVANIEPVLAASWGWQNAQRRTATADIPARINSDHPSNHNAQPNATPVYAPSRSDLTWSAATATYAEAGAWEENDGENPLALDSRAAPAPSAAIRTEVRPRSRPDGLHAVRLGVGPSLLMRRNYGVRNALTPQDAQGWVTAPAAGVALSAELYPGAWLGWSWASYIGLGLSYARYFGLSWRTAGESVDHSASHQALAADLRLRYPVAIGVRNLVFSARVGYKQLVFTMNDDSEKPANVPDVAYSSLALGIGAEIALLPRWLILSAQGAYMPVLDRGEIVTDSEYGAASGGAFNFGGSLRGKLIGPVGWRLALDYSWYSLNFLESPSARRQAEQVRDRYLTAAAHLTFVN